MKSIKNCVIEKTVDLVNHAGYSEIIGWPPICFGAFYQPERPVKKVEDDTITMENQEK